MDRYVLEGSKTTVGLIAVGAVFVSREVSLEIVPIAIFFITMLLSIKFKVNPVIITFLMMIIGAIACV